MRYLGYPFLHFSNLLIAALAIQQTYISSQLYGSQFGLSMFLFIGSTSLLCYHFLQNTKILSAESQRSEWIKGNAIIQNGLLLVAAITSVITLFYIPQPLLLLPGLLLLLSYKSPLFKNYLPEIRNRGYLKNFWIALTWCYVTQIYPILAFEQILIWQNVSMSLSLFWAMSLLYDLPELKEEKRKTAHYGAVFFLFISQVCWIDRGDFAMWLMCSSILIAFCMYVPYLLGKLGRYKFQYLTDVFLLFQATLFQIYIFEFQFL